MLKLPICNFDAKTGILCAKCESKLKVGEITRADVEASKALVKLADKYPELSRVALIRAAEVSGDYVFEVESGDVGTLRDGPELMGSLGSLLGGRVWVVGPSASDRAFLEDLFYPARVLTVNTVWLPDGSKLTKVIVPARRGVDTERLRALVKEMRGIDLAVESERELLLRN